jgi:hypothetical protein
MKKIVQLILIVSTILATKLYAQDNNSQSLAPCQMKIKKQLVILDFA